MIAIDDKELGEAVAQLTGHRQDIGEFEEELALAGDFVFRFGALGEIFHGDHLVRMQHPPRHIQAGAWELLAHWSAFRGDPDPDPHQTAEEMCPGCDVCPFLENVWSIRDSFNYERCEVCGNDLDRHTVGVDPLGLARTICLGAWERVLPLAEQGGDAAEYQISDAWNARWIAKLADGSWALVTRTYYIGKADNDDHSISGVRPGQVFLERQDEYLTCSDPADPGGTECGPGDLRYTVLDSENPELEDPFALAEKSFAPEPGEWEKFVPHSATWARLAYPN